jgi:hypothetical protein
MSIPQRHQSWSSLIVLITDVHLSMSGIDVAGTAPYYCVLGVCPENRFSGVGYKVPGIKTSFLDD